MVNTSASWKLLKAVTQRGKSNYTESELVLPALQLLNDNPSGLNTSALIDGLTHLLSPRGHDAATLPGRRDSHFSQKVRNLKSHNTLTKLRLAVYSKHRRWWKITEKGRFFVSDNSRIITALREQGLDVSKLRRKEEWDFTGTIVEEGALDVRTSKERRRCQKLKRIAIEEFKRLHSGQVFCTVCDFSFERKYGPYGKNYIEVHHLLPVHLTDIRGSRVRLKVALERVALLCSNCHRMVHRKKEHMLQISELKDLIERHTC